MLLSLLVLYLLRCAKLQKGCVGLEKRTRQPVVTRQKFISGSGREDRFFRCRRRGKNGAHEMRNWCTRNYFFTASLTYPLPGNLMVDCPRFLPFDHQLAGDHLSVVNGASQVNSFLPAGSLDFYTAPLQPGFLFFQQLGLGINLQFPFGSFT